MEWRDRGSYSQEKGSIQIISANKSQAEEELYKRKRDDAEAIVRKTHDESRNKFVDQLEHDVHSRQLVAYIGLKTQVTQIEHRNSVWKYTKTCFIYILVLMFFSNLGLVVKSIQQSNKRFIRFLCSAYTY